MQEFAIGASDIRKDNAFLEILDMHYVVAGLRFVPIDHKDIGPDFLCSIFDAIRNALELAGGSHERHVPVVGKVQFEDRSTEVDFDLLASRRVSSGFLGGHFISPLMTLALVVRESSPASPG